jgi:hypothetical protein
LHRTVGVGVLRLRHIGEGAAKRQDSEKQRTTPLTTVRLIGYRQPYFDECPRSLEGKDRSSARRRRLMHLPIVNFDREKKVAMSHGLDENER